MNDHTNTNLEQRLERLDQISNARRTAPQQGRRHGGERARRSGRAQGTKLVTAGASATAIVGLMTIYGLSSASASPATASDATGLDSAQSPSDTTLPGDLVVVVDSAGNVISAPASVSPDVVSAAVAAWRAESVASTTTLAPVAEPTVVDLAVPAVESPATTTGSAEDSTDTATAATEAATTQPTTTQAPTATTAPAAPQRQAPQARSSGS